MKLIVGLGNPGSEYRLTPTLEAYEALFEQAGEKHRWVCDASVWQMFSPNAVPAILDYCPDASFIVMLRNPVRMVPSMHRQQLVNRIAMHVSSGLVGGNDPAGIIPFGLENKNGIAGTFKQHPIPFLHGLDPPALLLKSPLQIKESEATCIRA